MDKEELGKIGQEKALELLLKYFNAKRIFQVDWISYEDGFYILNEIKNQEPYEPPPFRGQGLPLWQVKARLQFYKDTGIRCRLIVFNPLDDSECLWQWLDILESGKKKQTNGEKPRRIYPIENYNRLIVANSRDIGDE